VFAIERFVVADTAAEEDEYGSVGIKQRGAQAPAGTEQIVILRFQRSGATGRRKFVDGDDGAVFLLVTIDDFIGGVGAENRCIREISLQLRAECHDVRLVGSAAKHLNQHVVRCSTRDPDSGRTERCFAVVGETKQLHRFPPSFSSV
jgi:hypothetical protein